MAGTFQVYDTWRAEMGADSNMDSVTFYGVLLSAGYSPSLSDLSLGSIESETISAVAGQLSATFHVLTNTEWSSVGSNTYKFDCDDATFTYSVATYSKYFVVYRKSDDKLVCYCDLDPDVTEGVQTTQLSIGMPSDGLFELKPYNDVFSALLTNEDTQTAVTQAVPGYLESYTDQKFGTTVTRISGVEGSAVPNTALTWGEVNNHFYSKVSAWSCNDKWIWMYVDANVGAEMVFLYGDDYTVYKNLQADNSTWGNFRWHPLQEDVGFYCDGNTIKSINIVTEATTLEGSFAGYTSMSFGNNEGNFSHDGTKVTLDAVRSADGGIDVFVYDLSADVKGTVLDLGVSPTYDWTTVSPRGDYVVIEYDLTDTKIYDTDMNFLRSLTLNCDHADLGLDHLDREVIIGHRNFNYHNWMHQLSDASATELNSLGHGVHHTSMRNIEYPGWCYSSMSTTADIYKDEIVSMNTEADTIRRWCHQHQAIDDYWTECLPCPSRDGRRILWNSAWENTASFRPVYTFVVELP